MNHPDHLPIDELAHDFEHLDVKPPLISSNSAPPVLQSDYDIQENFTFGSCPANGSAFLGTPATEKGAFEYPESSSASSSRRPSLMHPALRRGSSVSSTTSTTTITSISTRRPSLAPLYTPLGGAGDYDMARRRGSLAHFPAKPVHAPIPPSLLARRGSLPAADALFGVPLNDRRGHNSRSSLTSSSPIHTPNASGSQPAVISHSPPPRQSSFRLRLPPTASARRGSLSASPNLPAFVAEQGEPNDPVPMRNRQSSTSSSTRGSNLSRSSFSSEEALQDDDSTDDASAVETPSSICDTEARDLFSDPWAANVKAVDKPIIQEQEYIHDTSVRL